MEQRRQPHRQGGERQTRSGGARTAPRQRSGAPRTGGQKRKKKRSPLAVFGRVILGLIVALSAVIVVAYAGMKLMAKMPDYGADPDVPVYSADPENPDGTAETPLPKLERKDKTWTFLLACTDVVSGNTDTMMVGMYDTVNQKAGLVSIPRDTLVNATVDGQTYRRINGLYGTGVENLQREMARLLGIPIDHYVVVDVEAFIKLVDLVGGIDYNVPIHMAYDDPTQELYIRFEPGMRHLNGEETMKLCRFRKSNDTSGTELTDAGRNQIQRDVMAIIARKVLANPQKIGSYLELFYQHVKTDLKLEELLWFVDPAARFDMDNLTTGGLTGDYDVHYKGNRWYFLPDREESTALINAAINPYTTELPPERMRIFNVN